MGHPGDGCSSTCWNAAQQVLCSLAGQIAGNASTTTPQKTGSYTSPVFFSIGYEVLANHTGFLSRDPILSLEPRSINPYQYAKANPLRFVDPAGLSPSDVNRASKSPFAEARSPDGLPLGFQSDIPAGVFERPPSGSGLRRHRTYPQIFDILGAPRTRGERFRLGPPRDHPVPDATARFLARPSTPFSHRPSVGGGFRSICTRYWIRSRWHQQGLACEPWGRGERRL